MSLTLTQAKECIKDLGRDGLENLIQERDEEIIVAALECGINPSDIDEAYYGHYRSDEDFAQEMADQIGAISKDVSWPYTCIDWEYAAKELMYDYSESNGHYFRNL